MRFRRGFAIPGDEWRAWLSTAFALIAHDLLTARALAEIEGPADLECKQQLLVDVVGFLEKLDRAVHPFDGSREVAGLGAGGCEGVEAIFVGPVGQLTGTRRLVNGSPAVSNLRIFTARQRPGEPLVSQRMVRISLDERLELSDDLGELSLPIPDSASLKVRVGIRRVDIGGSIEVSGGTG